MAKSGMYLHGRELLECELEKLDRIDKVLSLVETNHQLHIEAMKAIKSSGFEDLPIRETCNHPSHNPPTHLYIPHGKQYRHVCPKCGHMNILRGSSVTF